MASVNQVGNALSGATGSGKFFGRNSGTMSSPTLGVSSATSIDFTSTTEVVGTTTNNDAAAGSVGQYASSQTTSGSAVTVNNLTNTTITSMSLTAGDWDLFGNGFYIPGATTTIKYAEVWTGTATTTPNDSNAAISGWTSGSGNVIPTPGIGLVAPFRRISISSTTTVYLVIRVSFTGSTGTACGILAARRIR